MGGEKGTRRSHGMAVPGSPPRGRGKAGAGDSPKAGNGITPAWAGKRFWTRPGVWATSDHPRMGGEKSFDQACTGVVEGSPPHGRGKDVRQVGAVCGRGITPAWAGKRCSIQSIHEPCWDHPRVGGEKLSCISLLGELLESPPRRRGKATVKNANGRYTRITPAQAGKCCCPSHRRSAHRDHPRRCREKCISA